MTDRTGPEQTVECCACGWTGRERERPCAPSEALRREGIAGLDHVCPQCGHDTFYLRHPGDA